MRLTTGPSTILSMVAKSADFVILPENPAYRQQQRERQVDTMAKPSPTKSGKGQMPKGKGKGKGC